MDQNALIQFLPLVLIFIVFYFLLIRPQQKKQKDHRTISSVLSKPDPAATREAVKERDIAKEAREKEPARRAADKVQ